jgi:hypothetical protein
MELMKVLLLKFIPGFGSPTFEKKLKKSKTNRNYGKSIIGRKMPPPLSMGLG